VEDPGLPSQWRQFAGHGLVVAGQPVDGEGLVVKGLRGEAVLATPAHQFPTGAVLSAERRRALLGWALAHGALVIEDDYDAEFRYDQVSVRALQGLAPGLVAYLGTVSKTLAPALRLGWVVVPPQLAAEAARIKALLDAGSPALDQRALATVIRSGDYERHLRRARAVYRRRHDELWLALRTCLPALHVQGVAAGLHLLLRLPPGANDLAVAAACERAAIRVSPLSAFTRGEAGLGLVLGYGRLPEADAAAAVRALAGVLARSGVDTGA
jgi:GntR family transcriptional regulator/MocR family aminotransferase